MNVYFRNSQGEKRMIAKNVTDKDEAWQVIHKFLDDHNFKSYYTRMWYKDGYTWYDVGSHTEFFMVDCNVLGDKNEHDVG